MTIPRNHYDHMTEGLILALIVSGLLAIVAYKMQNLPVMFISSIGWTVCGLQSWQQTQEILPMLLLFMLAFGQFFMVRSARI